MDRLREKKVLVIGGSTGIGREVCRCFAREGADIVIGDRGHETEKESLVTEMHELGRDALAVEVNVLDEGQVHAAVTATIERFGRIDVLVNNAGIGGPRVPVQELSIEEYEAVLNTNLRGVFFGMKHALPHMIARGYGRIINTASQLAHKPAPLNAPYCASKAGVVALTVSVAQEVALQGITVNAVCPGPTNTAMWQRQANEADATWRRWKIDSLPMKRVGEPIEIAWAYVYLASDEASYCTGQSISPNGGDVMW